MRPVGRILDVFSQGSFRNPFVHSLSVTLGNHTNLGYPPYNCLWPSTRPSERIPGEDV